MSLKVVSQKGYIVASMTMGLMASTFYIESEYSAQPNNGSLVAKY
jgi:hypothetical protein